MKEIRLVLKVRNNVLMRLREELGLSAKKASKAAGVCYNILRELESLKRSPIRTKTKEWSPAAKLLADFYGVSCDYIWPEALRGVTMNVSFVQVEAGIDEIQAISAQYLELDAPALPDAGMMADAEVKERAICIPKLLALLTLQEQEVLKKSVMGDMSDTVIAEQMKISKARVGKVRTAALKKLRRNRHTRDLLNG